MQTAIIIACVALFIIMVAYYAKQSRPVKSAVIGMGSGLAVLFAANLAMPFFGIEIGVNLLTVFISLILGPPGVVFALVMNVV